MDEESRKAANEASSETFVQTGTTGLQQLPMGGPDSGTPRSATDATGGCSATGEPLNDIVVWGRDTVTVAPRDGVYDFSGLDDRSFHNTLVGFVAEAHQQYAELGLNLYYKILPGIEDARRRFVEYRGDPKYELNGCKGFQEYVKALGVKPATLRKWRERAKERETISRLEEMFRRPCKHCGRMKGHEPACPRYPALPPEETEAQLLAKQWSRMEKTLLGPSIMPEPERLKCAVELVKEVRDAAASGRFEFKEAQEGSLSSGNQGADHNHSPDGSDPEADDPKLNVATPKALFNFLNTKYIDVLDAVFGPESDPKEFATRLQAFAEAIARAFHGDEVQVTVQARKKPRGQIS